MDYHQIAVAGGIPKPAKTRKKKSKLKSNPKSIPQQLKVTVLETKGRLCFMGYCPRCGACPVGIDDDFHHFPHRSRGGQDCIEHLWPCRRECHDFVHRHPIIEREMFKEIEATGKTVVWKAKTKGIGLRKTS